MGTSASSTGPNNRSPLLPPWAGQGDPVEVGAGEGGDAQQEPSQEIDNGTVQDQIPGPAPNIPSPNRLTGARRAFGDYAKSDGDRANLRGSLKKYSRSSGGVLERAAD